MRLKFDHPRRGLPDSGRRVTRAIHMAVRRVPGDQRAGMLAVVTVLTLVPAGLESLGTKSTVRVDLRPVLGVRQAPGQPLPYVKKVLRTQILPLLAILSTTPSPTVDKRFYRSLAVTPDANRSGAGVQLSALSSTPDRDAGALQLVAAKIAATSNVAARLWLRVYDVLLPQWERALRRRDLSPATRRHLLEEEVFVRVGTRSEPPAGPLEAEKVSTSLHGVRARIIALLPGSPGRPSPLWAAAAGFILGVCLCGTWIYMTAATSNRASRATRPIG